LLRRTKIQNNSESHEGYNNDKRRNELFPGKEVIEILNGYFVNETGQKLLTIVLNI